MREYWVERFEVGWRRACWQSVGFLFLYISCMSIICLGPGVFLVETRYYCYLVSTPDSYLSVYSSHVSPLLQILYIYRMSGQNPPTTPAAGASSHDVYHLHTQYTWVLRAAGRIYYVGTTKNHHKCDEPNSVPFILIRPGRLSHGAYLSALPTYLSANPQKSRVQPMRGKYRT